MKKLFILFVALALVGFTVPAMAANDHWSFYGSSRLTTFYTSQDADAGDDKGTTWNLQGNSRIGASVTGDTISGGFEYGTGINLRLLYAKWNFGGGTLLVGQHYGPANLFYGGQVYNSDAGMLNVGGLYTGRNPQINLGVGSFNLALLTPQNGAVGDDGDSDNTIPKVEASYSLSAGALSAKVAAGYQTYAVEGSTDAGDYDVTSWILGLGGGVNLGAVYIKGNVMTGRNVGNYWQWTEGSAGAVISGAEIKDTTTVGVIAVVGFKASDILSFQGGYGYVSHDVDVSGLDADVTSVFYVQAPITVASGFSLVPEVGMYNYHEDTAGADQGSMTYFGAKWQMNF